VWILCVVFGISLVGVGVPQVLYFKANAMVRSGEAGSEFIVLAFLPLFVLMPLFMVAGTISATALALGSRGTAAVVWWVAIAAAFGSWTVVSFAMFLQTALRQHRESREHKRIMSQEEMVSLIRAFAINSFTNEMREISVNYVENFDADGNYVYQAGRADPAGYQLYVDEANLARRLGAGVTYFNKLGRNDPASAGTRWLSVDEARELLLSGSVESFTCGSRDPYEREIASGEPTGIKVTDFGWVRHLYVEQRLADTMVPIAQSVPAGELRIHLDVD